MNSKLNNMNFFRKMGIVTTIIFCSHNIFGQTTTSAQYEYDAECLGVELDGSQTLRIWGVGRNKKDAVEQAKKNAVRTVLFKGIHGGLSGCNTKPVILEVNAEEKYEDYFNAFFMDGGEYLKYISMKDEKRINLFKKDKDKEKSQHFVKYGITVRVLRAELKKRLTDDNVLKKQLMKKIIICSLLIVFMAIVTKAQVKKPTLMVVPADNWCVKNGYMDKFNDQGTVVNAPNYKRALQNSSECYNVITKINALMSDRSFPLKDLSAVTKSLETNQAMDAVTTTKSGAGLSESPLEIIKRNANADIIIELNWSINTTGPKRSVTFSLAAKDAYTDKQVAGCQGTGSPSFSSDTSVLLEEAVIGSMDNFTSQLQAHFDDMMENGREVSMEVKVVDNGSGIDLTKEYGGDELTDIIDDWVSDNSVNHRYNLSQGSENFLKFEQIRIALYQANGRPNDTRRWARELVKMLSSKYQVPCRVDIRGLGKAVVMLGEK